MSISFELSECIDNLDFISNIEPNHKPCFNTKTTIGSDSWFTTIRRRWSGEKGEKGVIHVNAILDSCDHHYRMCYNIRSGIESRDYNIRSGIDLVGKSNNNPNLDMMRDLSRALRNSIKGFDNLILTYKDQEKVAEIYTECKNRVIQLDRDIINYINMVNHMDTNHMDNTNTDTDTDDTDTDDSNTEYTEWGSFGSFHSEKKSMLVSMLDSEDSSSDHRGSFFTTNNMILLKEGKRIRIHQ